MFKEKEYYLPSILWYYPRTWTDDEWFAAAFIVGIILTAVKVAFFKLGPGLCALALSTCSAGNNSRACAEQTATGGQRA